MWFSEYKAVITGTRDINHQRSLNPYEALFGGMSAGCFSTILNNPVDFLKTRMQGVDSHKYTSTLDCLVKSVKDEGVNVLYRGVVPRLGRVIPGQGIIFMSFEMIQDFIARIVKGKKH
mmetsp:Transcript_20144/g.28369  ORF Transcript_20144/g.28369 Transcript_20144/m.28369 type:complete len:118 (+) Transcript_20144:69-422(+)